MLVHGLWMPGWETLPLRRRLGRAGYRTRLFTYRSVTDDPSGTADRLVQFIEEAPGEIVHLLGHSLGGVLAIRAYQEYHPERIGRIVCLGSPLKGSQAGRRLARLPAGERLLGRSRLMLQESAVSPWSGGPDLGGIAGNRGIGGGQLLGGLPRPHDGTVAVDETHLDGETDHCVLPVSHFSMLLSRAVADEVVRFLRTGSFRTGSLRTGLSSVDRSGRPREPRPDTVVSARTQTPDSSYSASRSPSGGAAKTRLSP